jgi:hypothetical protein
MSFGTLHRVALVTTAVRCGPPTHRFLLEPYGVISQKIFVIATAVITSQKKAFFGPTDITICMELSTTREATICAATR